MKVANIIIKSDERRRDEERIVSCLSSGSTKNSKVEVHEYAEEINATMNEVKRKVGMR